MEWCITFHLTHVRLYQNSNLQRDMYIKDNRPFRRTLAEFEPTLVSGLTFRERRRDQLYHEGALC